MNDKELKIFIREKMQQPKKTWKYLLSTNCYAFALGIDFPEKKLKKFAYAPGTLGKAGFTLPEHHVYTTTDFMNNLERDLKFLGLDYREVKTNEKVDKDEWKIAIFSARSNYPIFHGFWIGFHFLRQGKDGKWYHKPGWFKKPTYLDDANKIIDNPKKCNFKLYEYEKCLCLKLKR